MHNDQSVPQTAAILVIFGITGDLSQRYLLPALYHLTKDGQLHPETQIIGITRRQVTTDQLFEQVELCVNEVDNICDPDALRAMRARTRMHQMDLDNPAAYQELLQLLNSIEEESALCMNRLYYLSVPPQSYQGIIYMMGEAGLNRSCQHDQAETRLLVEKPFGYDFDSAHELVEATANVFSEDQTYRIDHFLAKTTVQNILRFRYDNRGLDKYWNASSISSIEISASEQIGIEGRVKFYEPLGALRDFIQNHLLQILALVTMELPQSLGSNDVHQVKEQLLSEVNPVDVSDAVRGQYSGYLEEVSNPDSTTETYAGIVAHINNSRWGEVPLHIWTGKAMSQKKYEINVLLKNQDGQPGGSLSFAIQPNQGLIHVSSSDNEINSTLDRAISEYPDEAKPEEKYPNAYERVLTDAISGDHSLFATKQEVLSSWQIIQPVLDNWQSGREGMITYDKGQKGPLNG